MFVFWRALCNNLLPLRIIGYLPCSYCIKNPSLLNWSFEVNRKNMSRPDETYERGFCQLNELPAKYPPEPWIVGELELWPSCT